MGVGFVMVFCQAVGGHASPNVAQPKEGTWGVGGGSPGVLTDSLSSKCKTLLGEQSQDCHEIDPRASQFAERDSAEKDFPEKGRTRLSLTHPARR